MDDGEGLKKRLRGPWSYFSRAHLPIYLADLGEARGCSSNTSVIHYSLWAFSSFVKIYLHHHHALMDGDGAFSHNIDYVTLFKDILNLEGHPNLSTSSRVTVTLLNGWILPVGLVTSGWFCAYSLRCRLVL